MLFLTSLSLPKYVFTGQPILSGVFKSPEQNLHHILLNLIKHLGKVVQTTPKLIGQNANPHLMLAQSPFALISIKLALCLLYLTSYKTE